MPKIVRTIVNRVVDDSNAVISVLWISPALDGNAGVRSPEGISPGGTDEPDVCGDVRSLVGISPAWAEPESTHARITANAKCLILPVFSLS